MNKKYLSTFLAAAALFFVVASSSVAQLSKVCPRVVTVSSRAAGSLVQWKNNQVQRRGGVGSPLAGFLRQPTIIATQGRNPFTLGRATIYNRNGRQVCSSGPRLGCATRRGECLARYKFNCGTTAVRQATPGGAYVKVGPGLCINIPSAGRCYNVKVRDLCDGRTL
jgi:hypothetical protein